MGEANSTNYRDGHRTIAIVGAGFSGTVLAVRLLRRPAEWKSVPAAAL